MPIPTRSQSVKAPSQTVPQLSDPQTTWISARVGATKEPSKPHTRFLEGRGQPPAPYAATSHTRSSSTAISSLPRPRPEPGNIPDSQRPKTSGLFSELQRTTHRQTVSALPSLGHSRSQSTSVVPNERLLGQHVSSARPAEKRLLNKPAFNTHQQHFSPQKSNSATRTQSSRPEDTGLAVVSQREGRQTSRLQDELFQLSLVHQDSARVLTEFEKSVREKVDVATFKLRREREVVMALEAEHQQQVNVAALSTWLHEDRATVNERKIGVLSFCLNELADMGDEGQVIDQLRSEFARWLEWAQITMESELVVSPDLSDGPETLPTESPGMAWSRRVDGCLKRLELCQGLLQGLGEADSESGIELVLTSHRRLVAVMTEELCVSQNIIAKVMAYQKQRMSSTLNAALAELEIEDGIRERDGLWTSIEFG